MARDDKPTSSSRSHDLVLLRFSRFTALLAELYQVKLALPPIKEMRQLKQFCTGLVEGDEKHPWREVVSSLSAKDRYGLAHSLFLFRKVIPQERPSLKAFVDKMSSTQDDVDPHFLDFAIKMTRRLFRVGWDRSYQGHTLASCLSTSSCYEAGRKAGGGRGIDVMTRELRSEFCEYVLCGVNARPRGPSRIQAVESGGKWRIISIPPRVDNALRPLHKAMYSHLSQKPWLLRGDAKARRFEDFSPVEGEIFVSGDYESATDNLNSKLQAAIMWELLDSSTLVPEGIKEHAMETFNSIMELDGVSYVQHRGQLMGNLTSFPLLCLVNYITFRYSIRRKVPVKINGDDIVFRATPEEVTIWERNVAKGGLTLSLGKTMKDSRFFTLNSMLFKSCKYGKRAVVGVNFVRPKALWSDKSMPDSILSMNSRFYSFAVDCGRERKRVAREFFIRESKEVVAACRRSLTRGMGLDLDRRMLHNLGLWHRELFYLEQPSERFLPTPVEGGVPEGFVQVSKYRVPNSIAKIEDDAFNEALVDRAWRMPYDIIPTTDDHVMDQIRLGCSPYGLGRLFCSRVLKMLKMSRSAAWRWVYNRSNDDVFGRCHIKYGARVWVRVDAVVRLLDRRVKFVKPRGC